MRSFDLDTQRALVCVSGLVFLTASQVASYLGHPPSDALIGVFGTMVVGPLLEGTVQRYREARRMEKEKQEDQEG
jgi:hypothetical protein